MQGAGNQRLIRNSFHDGPLLQPFQVSGRNANVNAFILLEGSSGGCFQTALFCPEILNALELSAFKIT